MHLAALGIAQIEEVVFRLVQVNIEAGKEFPVGEEVVNAGLRIGRADAIGLMLVFPSTFSCHYSVRQFFF